MILDLIDQLYHHFNLENKECSYEQCSEVSYAIGYFLYQTKISANFEAYSCKVESLINFEDYRKGSQYYHSFFKLNDEIFDLTLSQFGIDSKSYVLPNNIPNYLEITKADFDNECEAEFIYNEYHEFLINKYHEIIKNR